MIELPRRGRWAVLPLLAALAVPSSAAAAPAVGSPETATADPPVARPGTAPCTVTLYSGQTFADFSPKPFTYAPPAACPGPWAKVVLEADFSVTAGRQFDRTAQIAIGHVNVYYGTTQEPSGTFGPSWHVERDLTDYGALLRTPQSGETNLGNLVDSTYTGILSGTARLLFYPASHAAPAPRVADLVLPLSDAPGGAALLATTASTLAPTLSLPTNVEAAYLDVIAQSQSADEFWITCVPDDVADPLFSCPGTAFREVEVTIDGQPAGIAPVYPWLYTGAIDPLLWRPIPGVQTLNFVPYRVDLTPFAGLLSNGRPHQVGLSVYNANNYFLVTGSLLLYRDAGSLRVTGAVTRNTLDAAPTPRIRTDLTTAADGSVGGTVKVRADRDFVLAGYVDTSHGRVETRIEQEIRFINEQRFVISDTQFVQAIDQKTKVDSRTETRQPRGNVEVETRLTYPLALSISQTLADDGSIAQTTTVDQRYDRRDERDGRGGDDARSRVENAMASTDTLLFNASGAATGFRDRRSSQDYFAKSGRACYSRRIAAESGLVTAIGDGGRCHGGGDDD